MTEEIRPGDKPGELLVFDHGFVRLDEAMADDLSLVNGARVSFAVRKEEMDARDTGLIRFLMRSGHGSPFEHNSFRFHIRCPIFVAREWFRHRVGCLTGDTRISFVDVTGAAPRGLSKSMDELWAMWTVGEKNGGALTRSKEEDISRMRLRVLDEASNEFTTAHIREMFESGVQPVYRVTLADGKQIDATRTHRFLTDDGWRTLEEAVGLTGHGVEARTTRLASFVINGAKAYQDRVWMEQRRERGRSVQEMADDAGCSYHTIRKWLGKHGLQFSQHERGYRPGHVPWNDGVKGYKLVRRWSPEQLEAIRKARSGPKSNFWRGGVSSERASIARWTTEQAPLVHFRYDYTCQVRSCLKRGGKLHAHHIVPVWLDE